MPDGGPPLPQLGWGPELGDHSKASKIGLVAALLVLACAAGLMVIAAVRIGTSAMAVPSRVSGQALPTGISDDAQTVLYAGGPEVSVGCREPDVTLATEAGVHAYYTNVVSCLNKTWAPKIRSAPTVVFWNGPERSPCSIGSTMAFYCATNQTLYLQSDAPIKAWNSSADSDHRANVRLWVTDTIAREYAHHVQQATGILAAAQKLEYDAPDHAAALDASRRAQLQATCLGAAFIGVNKLTYGITGLDLPMYNTYILTQPGSPNTGTPDTRQYWAARGFGMTDSAYCNPFTALPTMVK